MHDRRGFNVLLTLFALTMLFGVPGVLDRVLEEHRFSGMTQNVVWGLWAAAYTFFSGASAGAAVVASLATVFGYRRFEPLARFALLIAFVALTTAMLFIVADLGRAERALGVALHANPQSVMAWMVYLYTSFIVLVVLQLVIMLRGEWARIATRGGRIARLLSWGTSHQGASETRRQAILRALASVCVVFAISLPAGVGSLFAVLRARPYWNSGALPISATMSALASGGAMVIFLAITLIHGGDAFRRAIHTLGRMVGAVVAIEAIVMMSELFVIARTRAPHEIQVLDTIAFGPHAWVFWIGQIVCGTLVPLALLFRRQASLRVTGLAAFFVLAGVFSFRLNLVIPQLAQPAFPEFTGGLASARMAYDYMPTLPEWSFLLFGFGLAGTLFLAGFRLLPIIPHHAALAFEAAKAIESRRVAS